MLNVFVSGTYSDLKRYHDAVVEALRRLGESPENMTYFGAAGAEPSVFSIDKLRNCDVYVGIIGHRYGTVPEGEDRSITQMEYEFAASSYDAGGRIREILIYLADNEEVGLPPMFLTDPAKHFEKQREFRKRLMRHTTQVFCSPAELAQQVTSDLYRLAQGTPHSKKHRIFDHDEEQFIQEEFDTSSRDRAETIEAFMSFVVAKFEHLFDLKRGSIDVHPFFKDLKKELSDKIPGLSLDSKKGQITRSGIRHVVLRVATLRSILGRIPRDGLDLLGKDIGASAASDLMEHTIEAKGLIPKSSRALVTLWNFWDSTGGWGRFSLEQPEQGRLSDTWTIRVNNSCFVNRSESDPIQRHRDCAFRCGYIHGFLDVALKRLTEIIFALEPADRASVTLPEYARVQKVEHSADDVNDVDFFTVSFKAEQLSNALQHLRGAQEALKKHRYSWCATLADDAIESARSVLGAKFDEGLREARLDKAVLQQLDSRGEKPGGLIDAERARNKFDAANLVIQALANAKGLE